MDYLIILETDDWISVFLDGTLHTEGHSLNTRQLIDLLEDMGNEVTRKYIENVEEFEKEKARIIGVRKMESFL